MTKAGHWEVIPNGMGGRDAHLSKGKPMRKILSVSALAFGTMLALSACGSNAGSSPTAPTVEPLAAQTSSAPADPGLKKSPRGNIIKTLNEGASMTDKDGKTTVTFAVNNIAVDVPCTGPYPSQTGPENGHIVVLDVTIETTEDLGKQEYTPKTFDMNPNWFKFVGASGTTFNGSLSTIPTYSCLPDEQVLPSSGVGPAEKVTGKLVLDVPETTGILTFKPGYLGNAGGWEYSF